MGQLTRISPNTAEAKNTTTGNIALYVICSLYKDGSPMDDSKVDGVNYIKKEGQYFQLSGGGIPEFNGNRAITRLGQLFGIIPGGTNVVEYLEKLFYPAIAPGAALSVDRPTREIGESAAYTLSWTGTKQTNAITAIVVDGVNKTVTGNTQSGTQAGNFGAASGSYTKSMSVTAGADSAVATATVNYYNPIFYGTTAKNGTSQPITDADILGLTKQLATSRALNLANFGGGNARLAFVWPHSFDPTNVASFKVNGLANTDFTRVRSNSAFVNAFGATIAVDVWLSNNLYNSPLDTVQVL